MLPACSTQYEIQIIVYSTVGQKLEILKYDAQFPSQAGNIFLLDGTHIVTQYSCFSFAYIQFTVYGFQESRLTGTHFSYQVDELTFFQFKVYIVQYA